MSPDSTASIARWAMSSVLTNHWSESMGSMTSPLLCESGTRWRWSSVFSATPSASKSAQSLRRHSARSSPTY